MPGACFLALTCPWFFGISLAGFPGVFLALKAVDLAVPARLCRMLSLGAELWAGQDPSVSGVSRSPGAAQATGTPGALPEGVQWW